MAALVTSGGFQFSVSSIGGKWFWTLDALNQGNGQLYQIRDIITPFGNLLDKFPIPGDVILAMAESINQMMGQLAPTVAFVSPPVTSISITVTEGDPETAAGTIPVMNAGALGSFMTVTASPDVSWLIASPATVSGLGKNEIAQFNVSVNPINLIASGSPFVGHINIQDNRSPPTIIQTTVTATVLPKSLIEATPASIVLEFFLTSGVPGAAQLLIIKNNGPAGSVLDFTVAKLTNNSPWLGINPTFGGPLSSGSSTTIILSVISSGVPQIPGSYVETVRVTSLNASNSPVDIVVTLKVQ
jgi:hypothetical protein